MRTNHSAIALSAAVLLSATVAGDGQAVAAKRGSNADNLEDNVAKGDHDKYTYTEMPVLSKKEFRRFSKKSKLERTRDLDKIHAEAKALSDRLERYIRRWLAGKADARLPEGLLPPSIDNPKTKNWRLVRPEDVKAEDQWYVRPAHQVPADFSRLYFMSPDANCTYVKCIFVAPFNTELLVEGEFGHARFMDFQILHPFDPEFPTTSGFGAPEVPIADVDIEPDPGHTNPFRPGADRNAGKRSYHIKFELKAGNALALNPKAMKQPEYRAPGNTRVGGPFACAGPMGKDQIFASCLWFRYYATDRGRGPLGGKPLPKCMFKLNTGERFWLQCDFSLVDKLWNTPAPGYYTPPEEPPKFIGPTVGWFKMFGFWLTYSDGRFYPRCRPWGLFPKGFGEKVITKWDRVVFNRGPDRLPPGNYEISASGCNYHSYLYRVMWLGRNKVYVLRGRLPVTPKTRNGEPVATVGEARYWSISHSGDGKGENYPGLLYGTLMDDEVIVNSRNEYIIVYSRASERPSNARPECGVTWQDYGLESRQVFNFRWMSIMPDEHLPKHSPHLYNLPWKTAAWSQPTWDRSLIGLNNHKGVMGPYLPVVHYMTKQDFESLGRKIDPNRIPQWK